MKNFKIFTQMIAICAVMVFVLCFSFANGDVVSAQTTMCPNSSVTCSVTFPDGTHIASEKGKNDSAVVIKPISNP